MDIREVPLVPDLKIYAHRQVSKEHGRRRLQEMQSDGLIQPLVTPTGRRLLSFRDAEALAAAL